VVVEALIVIMIEYFWNTAGHRGVQKITARNQQPRSAQQVEGGM
jgi:hypothetical protein